MPATSSGRNQRFGAAGERLAVAHLERAGYRIVDRNVRRREGEIDLVAVSPPPGEALVFVEVKLRRAGRTGRAVEALSPSKQVRMRALAEAYAADHPELPATLRLDLIAIDLDTAGRASVRHVVSAVEGE